MPRAHPRHVRLWASLGLAAQLCLNVVPAFAQTRILLTLEWPPYTGVSEPDGGTTTAVVNKAFKAIGDDTRVGYFTWRRVLQLPRTDRRFAATYPMYYSDERAEHCYFSEPIGESPVGLVERRSAPVAWKNVADLKAYRIGVVQGYVNTTEFDDLMHKGEIQTLPAETDEQNLKNLIAGRVQAVIIDHNAFRYMSTHTPELHGMDSTLEPNPHLLIVHPLFMCFPRDPAGLALRDQFNHGLRSIKPLTPPAPGKSQ